MQRREAFERDTAETGYDPAAQAYLLPSRSDALGRCRAALEFAQGALLITGAAGAGKTWLWRRLAGSLPTELRTVAIDATPATGPTSLFRAIADSLRLSGPDPRLALRGYLVERALDSERLLLVVDEAHTLRDAILDELRILSNRLGEPEALAGMILVGQTGLLRRLSACSLTGLATRLIEQVHLAPLDADEACALLSHYWPTRHWRLDVAEQIHRDAAGNPQRLLHLARSLILRESRRPASPVQPAQAEPSPAGPVLEPEPPTKVATTPPEPLLGPSRPPLHEEEGLIEVGWEPGLDERASPPGRAESIQHPGAGVAAGPGVSMTQEFGEETVKDHYAALQAWNEWAQNQGRTAGAPVSGTSSSFHAEVSEAAEDDLRADGEPTGSNQPQFWAEGPGTFAPYSQLFSRMRPSKDAG